MCLYICGSAIDRKTHEPANCKITRGLGHLCFFLVRIQMPTCSRANDRKTLRSCQDNRHIQAARLFIVLLTLVFWVLHLHMPTSTVLFAGAAVWDTTTKTSLGRQAAGVPGARPAWPGRVRSVRSQTWGWCLQHGAAAVEAGACWCCKDLLWGWCYNPFFSCWDNRFFPVQGSSVPWSTQETSPWWLVLQHHTEWPWPSPFVRGPNETIYSSHIQRWKNQTFCHFVMLIVHLTLRLWLSWSQFLNSNKFAVI